MLTAAGVLQVLSEPTECGKSKAQVYETAESFATDHDFLPGDRMEPLIQRLGGEIEYVERFTDHDSLLVYGPREFLIRLSPLSGPERERFTLAHELGHYVLHSNQGARTIRAARLGSNRVEWEANWFAAAFLMPRKHFKQTCRRYGNDAGLVASEYLVSPAAARVRMQSLGIVG